MTIKHFKSIMALLLCGLMILGCVPAMAEATPTIEPQAADSDWYMAVLDDAELMAQYPYYAFADVNEDGVPVLFISTTKDSFVGGEDAGLLFTCVNGEATQAKAFGGNAGESFYINEIIHTLTYYYRYSGEGHLEVYNLVNGALQLFTTVDSYGPFHAPDVENKEILYLQDGQAIAEEKFNALWQTYANETYVVTYDNQVVTPVVTQAPQNEGSTYRTLSIGDRGDDVTRLQDRLNRLGYKSGYADGVFGKATKAAVIRFQEQIDFRHYDGVATPELQRKLFSKNAPKYVRPEEDDDEDDDDEEEDVVEIVMSVKAAQRRLRELGYTDAPADGEASSRFMEALMRFENEAGLPVDGILDARTIIALRSSSAPYYGDYVDLQFGDSGSHVAEVQGKLQELGLFTGDVDGQYGISTSDAVGSFKSYKGLSGSGDSLDVDTIILLMETDSIDIKVLAEENEALTEGEEDIENAGEGEETTENADEGEEKIEKAGEGEEETVEKETPVEQSEDGASSDGENVDDQNDDGNEGPSESGESVENEPVQNSELNEEPVEGQ